MNFTKNDLKTRNFRVYENIKYDYEKKQEIKLGFVYSQYAILKFDYSINMVAEFMERVSKLYNPPKYNLVFNVKNETQVKNEVMAEAFVRAKEKAEAIAKVSEKELKVCVKTDFRPFEESILSTSCLKSTDFVYKSEGNNVRKKASIQENIMNIFTPEDIEITETLYCLWLAE